MATIYTNFTHNVLLGVLSTKVTWTFGKKTVGFHYGIDIVPTVYQLTKVIAYQKGKVKEISFSPTSGNFIVLQHDGNTTTSYKHLADNSINHKVGDIVEMNTVIGIMGKTGMTTGAHLHFEIRINDIAVDPLPYLQGLKNIAPYKEIEIIMTRPDMPMLNVFVSQLNYRDKPNGNKLGVLPMGDYCYTGHSQMINGYEWGEIFYNDVLVYVALNDDWNKVVEIVREKHTLPIEVSQGGLTITVKDS